MKINENLSVKTKYEEIILAYKKNVELASQSIAPVQKPKRGRKKKAVKKCKCCGRELPLDDFNYWNKSKGTRMAICKECEHEKQRQKREYKKNLLYELKEVGCCICGEPDPVCLDFHHYNQNEKEFNISQAMTKNVPDMLMEASKCVVVCSNCHRKIHAGTINIEDYVSRHEYEYRRKLFSLYADALKNNGNQQFTYIPDKNKLTAYDNE